MKTGLIFDMDGTLWDSSENVAKAWNEKINQLGLDRPEITQQDIMGVMGLTMDKLAAIIFGDLPEKERMELLDQCCGNENDFLRRNGGRLYPELESTLA
ncbi:MAG: HAD family hydrolase, partial [Ruminococcus sp.]|nr:HAD family hydrolase [Ruminococcus sp.]